MSETLSPQPTNRRAVLDKAVHDGVRLWCRAKIIAYGIIGVWLLIEQSWPANFWYLAAILVFTALASTLIFISRKPWFRDGISILFAGLESLICVVVLMTPNPLLDIDITMTDMLRFTPMEYLFVFLASTALTLAPRLVVCAGGVAAVGWIGAVFLVLALDPNAFTQLPVDMQVEGWSDLAFVYDPSYVDLSRHLEQTMIVLVVTGLLAAAVWRARRLLIARLRSERARANLARYFAPTLVDELARSSHSLTEIAEHDVAVLFVDIIGFTRRCEGMGAAATMHFLREFHRRMDAAVFEHGGTLDKYIGDAVMATFGTPRSGPQDAANALACAITIQDVVCRWSAEMAARGAPSLNVGVGVHYGPVVMGDIGGEQRLEYAVIGDTVNVASRLEHLTRSRRADIVISCELAGAARAQGAAALLADFLPGEETCLPGRNTPVAIMQRPRRQTQVDAAAE